MKYQLCDFLDFKTLCEQLKGQTVSPAVECILIAQSRKRNLETKLLALSERYRTFSRQAFQEGVYNLPDATDFYSSLSIYIEKMRTALELTDKVVENSVFQVHEGVESKAMFQAFSDAIAYITQNNLYDPYIKRYKINSGEMPTVFILNAENEVTAIQTYDDSEGWDLEFAFAEFPYKFQVGDLISYRENYFVLASVCHADADTRWLPRADDTDMQLYCYCYEPDCF